MRIAVVAPSCTLDPTVPDRLKPLTPAGVELVFHPQCFLSEGHFAGPDEARIDAFVEAANDPSFDGIWFARGGYGACRVAGPALARLNDAAGTKRYLGYSDAGFLLAGLDAAGTGRLAHGPMPADINRAGGEKAVQRALDWWANPLDAPQRQMVLNLTVLSQLLGTPLQPDFAGRVLIVEEVSEYMYRIDRSLFHVTSQPAVRRAAGIMLGRCSDIPDNVPDFVLTEEEVCRHWCGVAGLAYLGRADVGHDVDNQVVAWG